MDRKNSEFCASCEKTASEALPLQEVRLLTADGEQHVPMCADCANFYENALNLEVPDFTFHILGGRTYTRDEMPSQWENDLPLAYEHFHITRGQLPYVAANFPAHTIEAYPLDINQFPLASFPLLEDFHVILIGAIAEGKKESLNLLSYEVNFLSPSRGFLAHFLYGVYTTLLIRQEGFIIPIGTFDTPYFDFDQGWIILLAADETFVYILTGSGLGEPYSTWFKVEKTRYYEQWEQAIQLARSVT